MIECNYTAFGLSNDRICNAVLLAIRMRNAMFIKPISVI